MRHVMRTIWLAAGLVVLAEGVAADNLIPNGGFESGKLSLTDPATGKSEDLWRGVSGTVRLYLQMSGNSPHPAYFDDFELTPRAEGPPPAVATDKQ